MTNKLPLSEVANFFSGNIPLFFGMASFEERCFSLLDALDAKISKSLIFKNRSDSALANSNFEHMMSLPASEKLAIELNIDSPIATADAFSKAIASQMSPTPPERMFIDITTFTHEQLLILLRVLETEKPKCRVFMGYTGAEAYSTNTDREDVWLSKGVAQVKSVLGYPGRFAPSRKLHLVVLAGFEHERATAMIERFEPAYLTLMCGDPSHSVSSDHYETNKKFFDELERFVERTQTTKVSVSKRYFSCVDPFTVKRELLAFFEKSGDHNFAVCPMNTKLSTVGVGLAARDDERIQLVYARAIEYNEAGYSKPSTLATIFEYPIG